MADANSVAREVMEYLLLRLERAEPRGAPNLAPPELHMADGALFGFRRAKILDEALADELAKRIHKEGRRFATAMRDEMAHRAPSVLPSPPRVERATVQEVLDDQLARIGFEIDVAAHQGRVLQPHETQGLRVAAAVVQALARMDILSELEERRWTEKIQRASDVNAEPVRTAHALARSADIVAARRAPPAAECDQPLVHPVPRCSRQTLLDLLLVQQGSEAGFRVEFIEVYADGFVMSWSGPPPPVHRPGSPFIPRIVRLRATDDLGTNYFAVSGGGGSAGGERYWGQGHFAPAIPDETSELRITIDEDGYLITLPRGHADRDQARWSGGRR